MSSHRPFGKRFRIARWYARLCRRMWFPGQRFFARRLYRPGPTGPDFEAVVPDLGGSLMRVSSRTDVEWETFFFGAFEAYVVRWLERLAPAGGVAIDVGANVGSHTLAMARGIGAQGIAVGGAGAGGRIIACEPMPSNLEVLRRNVALNGLDSVTVVPSAVGASSGKEHLFIPDSSSHNQGTASLTEHATREKIEVNCTTLDELVADLDLPRVDLVKIDVEGHEPNVLAGGRNTLERFRPVLVFEYVEENWVRAGFDLNDVVADLHALDYDLYVIGNGWLSPLEHGLLPFANLAAFPSG